MIGIQGFVPQGYGSNKEIQSSRPEIRSKVMSDKEEEEEDDDPLDAFMLDIDNQVQNESLDKSHQEKVRYLPFILII